MMKALIGFEEEGHMSNDVLMAFIFGILILAVFGVKTVDSLGRRSQEDDNNIEVRTANDKTDIRREGDGSDEVEKVCTSCEQNNSEDIKRVSINNNVTKMW